MHFLSIPYDVIGVVLDYCDIADFCNLSLSSSKLLDCGIAFSEEPLTPSSPMAKLPRDSELHSLMRAIPLFRHLEKFSPISRFLVIARYYKVKQHAPEIGQVLSVPDWENEDFHLATRTRKSASDQVKVKLYKYWPMCSIATLPVSGKLFRPVGSSVNQARVHNYDVVACMKKNPYNHNTQLRLLYRPPVQRTALFVHLFVWLYLLLLLPLDHFMNQTETVRYSVHCIMACLLAFAGFRWLRQQPGTQELGVLYGSREGTGIAGKLDDCAVFTSWPLYCALAVILDKNLLDGGSLLVWHIGYPALARFMATFSPMKIIQVVPVGVAWLWSSLPATGKSGTYHARSQPSTGEWGMALCVLLGLFAVIGWCLPTIYMLLGAAFIKVVSHCIVTCANESAKNQPWSKVASETVQCVIPWKRGHILQLLGCAMCLPVLLGTIALEKINVGLLLWHFSVALLPDVFVHYSQAI